MNPDANPAQSKNSSTAITSGKITMSGPMRRAFLIRWGRVMR